MLDRKGWINASIVAVGLIVLGYGILFLACGLASASRCQEDQHCWNWATMGNHKRGVVTLHGTLLVVGPCRFRRLHAEGEVVYTTVMDGKTYPQNQRLRGDAWALAHGCVKV